MKLRVGLPYLADSDSPLMHAAAGHPILVSAGAFYRPGDGFLRPLPRRAWSFDVALDCGGFTAMLKGGYRWSVEDYVEWVVMNGERAGDGAMPFPWAWWAAMDYCCEQAVAPDRAEVRRRMRLTVETYARTVETLRWWEGEGVNDVPLPLPTLQGRRPEDYLWSVRELARVHPLGRLPELVGVGSVCTRPLYGDEGLVPVMDALHEALPWWVKLHLFGVKGSALELLGRWPGRVASVDSMAWDRASRWAKEAGRPHTVEARAEGMTRWIATNQARLLTLGRDLPREEGPGLVDRADVLPVGVGEVQSEAPIIVLHEPTEAAGVEREKRE